MQQCLQDSRGSAMQYTSADRHNAVGLTLLRLDGRRMLLLHLAHQPGTAQLLLCAA